MAGTNRLQRGALSATTDLLVRAGPSLMRAKPVRRTIIGYFESWLSNTLKEERESGRYPPGVNNDRATMAAAVLHTLERAMCERYLAPNVLRRVSENLIQSALIDRGDPATVGKFRDQYGAPPPGFLVIAPGKTCNLQCAGCYADAGPTAERLDWSTFDRIVTEAEGAVGGTFLRPHRRRALRLPFPGQRYPGCGRKAPGHVLLGLHQRHPGRRPRGRQTG